MSNVPQIQFPPTGPVVPTEADILVGVQEDINTAFGGNLNPNLETPQGQLATSQSAIIAACYAAFINLANNFDPAYASGRFQDAIGRFYFLTRNPAQATVLQVNCFGLTGATIPVSALIQDPAGNLYACTQAGIIPASGYIALPFACTILGAISVPSSVVIYQTVSGWDSVTFLSGVEGNDIENRAAFELRRQQTVAANSNNTNAAIQGALIGANGVSGVVSAYVTDNYNSYPIANNPAATVTGYISGTTLTISSGVMPSVTTGLSVSGVGVINGTTISSGTGPYTVNLSQTVASSGSPISLQIGGVQIKSNTLYVCTSGGLAQSIANAIWSKKPPGCGFTGNTTETVYDASAPYGSPGIAYSVSFQQATNLPIFFAVNIKNSLNVPSTVLALVRSVIESAFNGADGGLPAQIGVPIINSRFMNGLLALGSWAQILSVQMASANDTPAAIISSGSVTGTTLTVTSFTSGSGTLAAGCALIGANISPGTTIMNQLTGTAGQIGTYTVNIDQTAPAGVINSYLVNNFQENINIDQMPTTSDQYITVNLI